MSSKSIYTRPNRVKNTEYFLEKAKNIHGDLYDYSMVTYTGTKIKVTIICKAHGEFLQTPDNHFNGRGCPKCRSVAISNSRRNSIQTIIERFKSVHGDLYDYSKVHETYSSNISKIKIICNIHGEYISSYRNHYTRKHGCPCCKNKSRNSIVASEWLNSLKIPTLIFEYTIPENKHRQVDAYDPTTNTIYQFHGSYWHSDPRVYSGNLIHQKLNITHQENYSKSQHKDMQLLCWGYNLIIMWEYDWYSGLNMAREQEQNS